MQSYIRVGLSVCVYDEFVKSHPYIILIVFAANDKQHLICKKQIVVVMNWHIIKWDIMILSKRKQSLTCFALFSSCTWLNIHIKDSMRIRDMKIINSSTIMQCTAHCIILLMMKSSNYPRLNFAELYISISSREKIIFSYYGIKTVLR